MFTVDEIEEVHPRRYNSIDTSVEIFLNRGKAYFFNLYEPKKRDNFINLVKYKNRNGNILAYTNKILAWDKQGYTKKW